MKKIISMILVFVMILSFMPIGALPAYAENEENSIQEIDQEVVNDTTPVENTDDQNLETNLGQTEGQELGEQTPGQEISEELDNLTENGDNKETELIISEPTQEQEQQAGENDAQGDAEEPVFVYFALTPADATVTVYTVDEENPEESQIVEPQDDPYLFLLQPGLYCYTVEATGYYDIAKSLLYVEPSDDTYIVERELERDESIVLEDESELMVSAQSISLMAGGQRTVTLSFDLLGLGEDTGPASITGPVGFAPECPNVYPYEDGYLFVAWYPSKEAAEASKYIYAKHLEIIERNTGDWQNYPATVVWAPMSGQFVYDDDGVKHTVTADSWKWGTSIARDITLYASWVPLSEAFINGYGSSQVYGSYDQYDYYYLHRLDHFSGRGIRYKWNEYGDVIQIRNWPFKPSVDYPATTFETEFYRSYVEDGWTLVGVQYEGEMIYYVDQRDEGDSEFWGYNGDTWDYNQLYEVWAPSDVANATYTVTFDSNGHGTAPEAQTLGYLHTIEQPEDLNARGYTFTGWYTDSAATEPYDFNTMVEESMTLYAGWKEEKATVTFDFAGHGNQENYSVKVIIGDTVEKPEDPTDDQYVFVGWKNASGTRFDFDSAITGDTTIYASWTAAKLVTVSFDLRGHGEGTGPAPITGKAGFQPEEPKEHPYEEGYIFLGWFTSEERAIYAQNKNNSSQSSFLFTFSKDKVIEDITLYAAWRPWQDHTSLDESTSYTLHYGGHQHTYYYQKNLNFRTEYTYHNADTVLTNTWPFYYYNNAPHERLWDKGWTFIGYQYDGKMIYYYDELGCGYTYRTDIRDNVYQQSKSGLPNLEFYGWEGATDKTNIYEVWCETENLNQIVTFNANGHGTAPEAQTVMFAHTVSQPADLVADGYMFTGWYTDRNATQEYDFETPVTGSMTLYAGWRANEVTVTFDSNGGSAVDAQSVELGTKASKPADPTKQGYVFGGWTLNGTEYDFETPVKSDITLVATWDTSSDTPYTVEYYMQAEAGSKEFAKNDSLTESLKGTTNETANATAKNVEGYVFDRNNAKNVTSGTIAADGSLVLKLYYKVDANKNGVADDEETFKVTFDSKGGSTVEAQNVKFGEKASKPADPTKQGYVFGTWQLNGAEYDFNTAVKSDITLVATWSSAGNTPYTVEYYKQAEAGSTSFNKDDSISDRLTGKTGDTATASPKAVDGFVYDSGNSNNVVSGTIKADGSLVLKLYYKVDANKNGVADDEETFKVTFDSNGGSTVEAQNVKFGEKASKPTNPTKQGYVFGTWQLNGAEYDFNTAVKSDITLVATWNSAGNTPYTVEYYKQAEAGSASFNKDDSISDRLTGTTGKTATASPKAIEGFVYDSKNSNNIVSGTIKADGSLVLKLYYKVDANKNGIADDEESFTITFDSNGGSAVDAQTVKFGEKASKPADPTKQGYVFGGWQLNGAEYDFNTVVKSDISLIATWNAAGNTPYTIEYYKQTGAGSASFTRDDSISDRLTGTTGDTATASPKAIEGFVYDSSNSNNVVSGTIKADGSLVLKLYYKMDANKNGIADEEENYTVTFNSAGGSAVEAQTVKFGEKASKPADPTKQGYVFGGWQLNGAEYDFNTAVKGDITLIATWNAAGNTPYTIEYYKQTEAGSSEFKLDSSMTETQTGATGATANIAAKPVEGFVYDRNNSGNVTSGTIKADGSLLLKLYYKVDANKNGIADDEEDYTVTFDSNGGSRVTAQTVRFGDKAEKPADPTKEGYVFGTWQLNGSDYDFNTEVKSDITLKAAWNTATDTPYTIEYYTQTSAGSREFILDSDLTETKTGTTGETANAEAKPVDGFVFDSANTKNVTSGTIAADGSLVLKLYYKVDANKNGIADDEETFTVSFDLGRSDATGKPEDQGVKYGKKASAPSENPKATGYEFVAWQLDGSNYDFNRPVTSDITLTASWKAAGDTPYSVEYYKQAEAGSASFEKDNALTEELSGTTGETATASPKVIEGFVFDSRNSGNVVSGTIAADGSLVLKLYYKVDANKNGIADDEEDYTVTFDSNGGREVDAQTVRFGNKVEKPADPTKQGYVFGTWTMNCTEYDFETPVKADITLVAAWNTSGDTPYTVEHYKQAEAGSKDYTRDDSLTENLKGTTNETANVAAKNIDGYVFDSDNANNVSSGTIAADGSLVLKLYYKVDADKNGIADDEDEYLITFDSNGGSPVESQKVRFGDTVKKPADPTKQGYVFVEWIRSDKLLFAGTLRSSKGFDFSTPVTGKMTLVAAWEAATDTPFTVEHYKQNEAGSKEFTKDASLTDNLTGATGETATAKEKEISGYVFDKNNTDNVITGIIEADGSLVLKLNYKVDANNNGIADDEEDYLVTFDSNGGSTVENQMIHFGDKASKPADPTLMGYVFAGWTLSGSDYDFDTPVKSNITLVAVWNTVGDTPYTVEHYMQKEAGSSEYTKDDSLTENLTGTTGATATATGKNISGYVFDSDNENNVASGAIAADGSLLLKLYYKVDANGNGIPDDEDDYTVTFDSNGGSAVESQTVHFGDKASKPADPTLMGYVFNTWMLDSKEYNFDTPIKNNITLKAVWNTSGDTPYKVQYYKQTAAGSDKFLKDSALTENLTGTTEETATVAAKAIEGYVFDSENSNNVVSGTIAADGSLVLKLYYKVDANHNGIADDEESFTVNFIGDDDKLIDTQTIHYGDCVNKPTDPEKTGYDFDGWKKEGKAYDFKTPVTSPLDLRISWKASDNTAYTVEHYIQTAAGKNEYTKDVDLTDHLKGTTEQTASAKAKKISGYVFDSDNENNVISGTIAADGSLVLKLYYKVDANNNGTPDDEEQYTVTFDSRGGSKIHSQIVAYGEKASKPAEDPTSNGKQFTGWFTDEGCAEVFDFNKPITANTTVYAGWIKIYTVSFNMNGVKPKAGIENQSVLDGELAKRPEGSPEADKYLFKDWYADAAGTEKFDFNAPITADTTVYAIWVKIHEVSFDLNNTKATSDPIESQFVVNGEKASAPEEAPTAKAARFTGWYKDKAATEKFDFSAAITADTTVYAGWINEFTVSFDMNNEKSDSKEPNQIVVDGDKASKPEKDPEASGYKFLGWTKDKEGKEAFDFTKPITVDTVVYAQWQRQLTVKFMVNNERCQNTYADQVLEPGRTAMRPAEDPTASGYRFNGWFKDAAGTEEFDFNEKITNDTIIYAGWTRVHSVQFVVRNSSASGTPKAQVVVNGEKADKPEDPTVIGMTFEGWFTDSNGTKAYDFTAPVTEDLILYDKWSTTKCSVIFNNMGVGTAIATQTVEYGAKAVEPTNVTADGYTFGGWYTDRDHQNKYDFSKPVTSSMTLYAKWTANSASGSNNGKGPMTGDLNNPGLLIGITVAALVALGGGGYILVKKNKKTDDEKGSDKSENKTEEK